MCWGRLTGLLSGCQGSADMFSFDLVKDFREGAVCASGDLSKKEVKKKENKVCVNLSSSVFDITVSDDEFDWENISDTLVEAKAKWQAFQATRYVYRFTTICACDPCRRAAKYVFVEHDQVHHVEFDQNDHCTECDLEFPLTEHYHTIDWF